MSDLFENHIDGFSMRPLIYVGLEGDDVSVKFDSMYYVPLNSYGWSYEEGTLVESLICETGEAWDLTNSHLFSRQVT